MGSVAGTTGTGEAAGPAEDGHTHESACLNCHAALVGDFCHACGQRAHVHRTIGAFWHDLLHGVLHFEGKTWRTLPMLAWRPGELTRRYIEGERARFVSPLALFLFTVFLMFAVFSSVGGPFSLENQQLASTAEIQRLDEQAARLKSRSQALEQERAALAAADRDPAAIDAQLAELRNARAAIESWRRIAGGAPANGAGAPEMDLSAMTADTGFKWLDKAILKWGKNPSLMFYKLQANAYKFSWLLIPISVPLVWLLFLWRRRHWQLYDHVVFVTYSLSFQSLTLITFAVLVRLTGPLDGLLLVFSVISSVHVFRQLRGAYGLGWFSALWRVIALTFMLGVALVLFALALIAIGAAG